MYIVLLTGTVIPPNLLTVCQCPENSMFRSKSNTGHCKRKGGFNNRDTDVNCIENYCDISTHRCILNGHSHTDVTIRFNANNERRKIFNLL